MNQTSERVRQAQAILENGDGVRLHGRSIEVYEDGDSIVLAGEVGDIAQKRLAVRRVADGLGVRVRDHLRVEPAERREDGAIADGFVKAVEGESSLRDANLRLLDKGSWEVLHDGGDGSRIDVMVESGTIRLAGWVPSLSHRRLVELLAWWTPGSDNVENYLTVVPPEDDTDDELTDAIMLALEKDPLVHADQLHVRTRDGVVTLEGLVRQESERHMAASDVWYVPGVQDLHNEVQVER